MTERLNQQKGNDIVQLLGPYVYFPHLLERVNRDALQPIHYVHSLLCF